MFCLQAKLSWLLSSIMLPPPKNTTTTSLTLCLSAHSLSHTHHSFTHAHTLTPLSRTHTHSNSCSQTNRHTPTLRVPTGLICKNCSKKDNFCQALEGHTDVHFILAEASLSLGSPEKSVPEKSSFRAKKALKALISK